MTIELYYQGEPVLAVIDLDGYIEEASYVVSSIGLSDEDVATLQSRYQERLQELADRGGK